MGYGNTNRRHFFQAGFTIVELLIVIVVVAILAAIVIVSYNGISTRARQTAVINDAHSAAISMDADRTVGGSYPTSPSAVNGGKGIALSDGNAYQFHSNGTTFCITIESQNSGINSYHVSNENLTPTQGACSQDAGSAVTTIAGNGTIGAANQASGGTTSATVASPAGMVSAGSGVLFFTDSSTSRIRKITLNTSTATLAGTGSPGYVEGSSPLFSGPQAIALNSSGNLVVADTNNHKVRIFNPTTQVSSFLAGSTQGNAGAIGTVATAIRFNVPRGIAVSPTTGRIAVGDSQNNRIVFLNQSTGEITFIAGQTSGGYTNGTGPAAQFNYPTGLAFDSAGDLYVADSQNHAIRKVTIATGAVTTVAGNGTQGTADGNGASARFSSPRALVVASDGTIYVSDSGNNLIRKIDTGGTVSTIAGSGTAGFADGTGAEAQFNNPTGIAIGSDGKLYVSDQGTHRIRALSL